MQRLVPPMNADERTTLEGWLDFYRATLASKCEGLDDDQLRTASAPPSELTLLGLMRHAAEVERNWFRRVLAGEQALPIYGPTEHPEGHDGGFELSPESSYEVAFRIPGRTRLPTGVPTAQLEGSMRSARSWAAM